MPFPLVIMDRNTRFLDSENHSHVRMIFLARNDSAVGMAFGTAEAVP